MSFIAGAREIYLYRVYRLIVSCQLCQRDIAVAERIQLCAVSRDMGVQDAGDWELLASKLGEIGDVHLRRRQIDLNGACLGKGPLSQSCAGTQRDTTLPCRNYLGILEASSRWA